MEQIDIDLEIIRDEKVSKEVKVNVILEMLYLEEISLRKAQRLCMEAGIFTKHCIDINEETINIHNEFYKKRKGE